MQEEQNGFSGPESDRIEREVQRRAARNTRELHEEIVNLRAALQSCKNDLVRQNNVITQMTGEPLMFGNVIKIHNWVEPNRFKANDEVMVIDSASPYFLKGGRIAARQTGPVVDADGMVNVTLTDETVVPFAVGVEGKAPAQVKLTQKHDGSYAVVNLDGKPWEVKGVPDPDLKVGDTVKVKPDNKAIVSRGYELSAGPICTVVAVLDDGVEVMHKGEKQLVHNPRGVAVAEGDRIACDPGMFCVIKKLPQDARNRYKVTADLSLSWDDIGGLDLAKQELRDALELPFQHPELFAHYNVEPLRGVLLYGPPGCGKTLLARVAAWAMAKQHGKSASDTGYIYVKAPEILDKWVGNTEKEIRDLFERGRRHYREHGYKAILAFDEADAIMPQRGSRRSSDVADTIVPMFLGEMDGIDSKQTQENPVVILLTNRADVLDPAVTRPGRISRHIKIDRPEQMGAIDILNIHTAKIPFADEKNRMASLAVAASDVFSKSRLLYRVNNEHDFTLGDCVNGAMLANVGEIAKMNALHRDLKDGTKSGLTTEDLRQAVKKVFHQQRGVNHAYDIADFCEKHGIQPANAQVDRCFGAA
jgi:proteasome-associated ATPase